LKQRLAPSLAAIALVVAASTTVSIAQQPTAAIDGMGANPSLPAPDIGYNVQNYSHVVGWADGTSPKAPAGFIVTRFAAGLDSPRWVLVLPNSDVLVAEATTNAKPASDREAKDDGQVRSGSAGVSANRITLLKDTNGDGVADARFVLLENLNQPFGMAYVGEHLYVANTDAVVRFPYRLGQTRIEAKGEPILALPAGGYNNHWTRNLLPSRDGRTLFVSVGSASNVGEYGLDKDEGRAVILEINLDGSGKRVVASGLRNPVGMAIEPQTGALWAAVNERDMLGGNLVPDYITSVKAGAFYGWPFSYYGQNEDPRLRGQRPDLVAKAVAPDYALGAHTASLGITFYNSAAFPQDYRGGAFVSQRGSWNRKPFSGYKVLFVPFQDGRPAGPPQDFLTGFLAPAGDGAAFGRPVGVFVDGAGALLVTDDAGSTVWRVSASNPLR
jgi:glucose/arabinose dehydrogenase